MQAGESSSPTRYPSLAWWIVLVLTVGAVVGAGVVYVKMHREEAFLKGVDIPAYPKAMGLRDRVGGSERMIVFRAPATYPRIDVGDFYQQVFTTKDGWEPDPRSKARDGKWIEQAGVPTTIVGKGTVRKRPPRGPTREYSYGLRNSAKDASVDLYVREDMLKEPGNTQTAIIFVYRGGGPRFGPLEFLMGVGTLGLRWLAGVFALGAVFGSIINTLAYRLGRGLPVLRRPECPECGAPRTAVEMVPILGWLVSFGRCRTKGERIGARQPVLAAIGGFMLYGATLGGGRYFVAPVLTYVACAALLVALVVELDRVTAPAKVYWTVGGAAVLLDAWHIVRQGTRWMLNFPFQHGAQTIIVSLPRCVVGAAIGAAAMLALARLVSGRWGLLGDVKVAAVVGALVATAGYSPKWPLAAVLAGAVIGLIVWLARRLPEGRPRYLPLAMAAAGLVAALAPAALMMFAPTMTNMLLFGL